jgi:hypothetical protein
MARARIPMKERIFFMRRNVRLISGNTPQVSDNGPIPGGKLLGACLPEFEEVVVARLAHLETLFENPRFSIRQHYFPILSWIRAKGSQRLTMEVELENRTEPFP